MAQTQSPEPEQQPAEQKRELFANPQGTTGQSVDDATILTSALHQPDMKTSTRDVNRETQHGTKEPIESWTIFGLRVKITEMLLVIFTFLLFLATFALWHSTKDLVTGADRNAETQLRAYVLVSQIGVRNSSVGNVPVFRIEVKNSGQTPAHDLIQRASMAFDDYPLNGDLPKLDYIGPAGKALLEPNGGLTANEFKAGGPLTAEHVAELNAGTKAFYVYGEITYRDVFGKDHYTKFRFMRNSTIGGSGDGYFAACTEGNEAN